ncbi:potassium channel subfamily K member 18 [Gopherus flavomarginatus]|uniref:potassium channel subfamily K member 18 n=1 Tax=Gopherus flavomarginatus TaxID=286002 RepID=UPI0021CC1F87|nr:potassium channel subfamily K member 18 [Gopherus flavomarginatus]
MELRPRPQQDKKMCTRVFWMVFPHACFISSLVIYAFLGAVMFSYIEGNRNYNESKEYKDFMLKLWNLSKDLTENMTENEKIFKKRVHDLFTKAKLEWFADPKEQWSLPGSLFFCCTVFTTVGYGHSYPVTKAGKYLCMLYALFGIPLMFLVLTDLGDILATILAKSYNEFRKLQSKMLASKPAKLCSGCICKKNNEIKTGSSLLMLHKIVIQEPLSITEVLKSHSSVKRKSLQSRNAEIFEMLIARENQCLMPPRINQFERWSSCPELDSGKMTCVIENFGKELEKLDVPILLMALIVFAYISCAAAILPQWENHMDFEEAFYFCFITLTTIGFGDIHLEHPNFFLFFSLYIVIGMEIVIIAFKLGQNRLIGLYRKVISYVSKKTSRQYEKYPCKK